MVSLILEVIKICFRQVRICKGKKSTAGLVPHRDIVPFLQEARNRKKYTFPYFFVEKIKGGCRKLVTNLNYAFGAK